MRSAATSRTNGWLAIAGLVVGLLGCQTFNVRTDWDPDRLFDGYQRYVWVEPPEVEGASPFADNALLRKRLRRAIEDELAERGFRAVRERTQADFLVTYSVILEERLKVDGYSATAGGGYYHRYGGFGSIHSSSSIRTFQESTLIIDFLDPRNDDLVWRGWSTGIVGTRDRERGDERIASGVDAILNEFPPEATDAG